MSDSFGLAELWLFSNLTVFLWRGDFTKEPRIREIQRCLEFQFAHAVSRFRSCRVRSIFRRVHFEQATYKVW